MTILFILFLLLPFIVVAVVIAGAVSEARRAAWPFAMGRVISNTLGAIGAAPLLMLAAGVMGAGVPRLLLGLLGGGAGLAGFAAGLGLTGAKLLSWMLIGQLAQLVTIGAALDGLAGRPIDVRTLVIRSLRLLPGGIVIAVLTAIGVGLGLVLLVVPGMILASLWVLATPAMVAEGIGPLAAIGRSVALTQGARWRILLLLAIVGFCWLVVTAVTGVAGIALQASGATAALLIDALIGTLTSIVSATGLAALFHEVRVGKEGAGDMPLEAVFA